MCVYRRRTRVSSAVPSDEKHARSSHIFYYCRYSARAHRPFVSCRRVRRPFILPQNIMIINFHITFRQMSARRACFDASCPRRHDNNNVVSKSKRHLCVCVTRYRVLSRRRRTFSADAIDPTRVPHDIHQDRYSHRNIIVLQSIDRRE